ncbi:MAG TPA: NAD kinase [Bacilli bacterium]
MIYALFGEHEFKEHVGYVLNERGHICDEENPEFVFSIGGDGTILKAIKKYIKDVEGIKFVGINLGRLGFYTSYEKKEFEEALEQIENNKYQLAHYNLLEYLLKSHNLYKSGFGLNEITIINPIHTQIIDVYINDKHFETFRGTGFLAATPTGSTAYNKSLGGSVIDPNICALQLTEIASINNRVYKTLGSPLVLSQETIVKLKSNFANAYVTVDGMYEHFTNLDEIIIRLSSRKANFVIKEETDFWDCVKKSFLE